MNKIDPVTLSRILFFSVIGLVIILAGTTVHYYNKANNATGKPRVLSAQTKNNPKSLLEAIAQLTELPKNETPTIATIDEKNKLNNELLKNSENGDKIIIYLKSKLAILYRPSTNKLVMVVQGGFIAPQKQTQIPPSTPSASPTSEINITPSAATKQASPTAALSL